MTRDVGVGDPICSMQSRLQKLFKLFESFCHFWDTCLWQFFGNFRPRTLAWYRLILLQKKPFRLTADALCHLHIYDGDRPLESSHARLFSAVNILCCYY